MQCPQCLFASSFIVGVKRCVPVLVAYKHIVCALHLFYFSASSFLVRFFSNEKEMNKQFIKCLSRSVV